MRDLSNLPQPFLPVTPPFLPARLREPVRGPFPRDALCAPGPRVCIPVPCPHPASASRAASSPRHRILTPAPLHVPRACHTCPALLLLREHAVIHWPILLTVQEPLCGPNRTPGLGPKRKTFASHSPEVRHLRSQGRWGQCPGPGRDPSQPLLWAQCREACRLSPSSDQDNRPAGPSHPYHLAGPSLPPHRPRIQIQ